jgi:nicotinamide mononucleotide adenylyltransferase
MTNGVDELFRVKEFEDVINWIERLEMATKVWNYDEAKLFKIAHFNLRGKVKEWYKHIELAYTNWVALKAAMEQKYGALDPKEIRVKFDAIKQEPRQWMQLYYDRLEKLLTRGKIKEAE